MEQSKSKSNNQAFTALLAGSLGLCLLAWMGGGDMQVAVLGGACMIAGLIGLSINS